jgi:hypothetical protein
MPNWFATWLNGLSTWPLALFICAGFVGITWLGIVLIHPHLRKMVHGDEPSNEVIIHSASIFGLSYAVLLGLLTIATFDSIKNLTGTIDRETSSLSTLYRTADGYPDPLRSDLKAQLRDYTRYVIEGLACPQQRPGAEGRRTPAFGAPADRVFLRAYNEDAGAAA